MTLPAKDLRMQIQVLEMDNVESSSPRVHAVIAQVGVTDPATCPHEKPCKMDMPKGSLVLSFSTQSPGAAAAGAAALTQMDGTSQTGGGTQTAQATEGRF